jgi:hypoxanthine phosphoribosyltransferase
MLLWPGLGRLGPCRDLATDHPSFKGASMDPPLPCLLSSEQLAVRVRALAQQVSADYAGRQPLVVGVLKGAWVFMADLVRQLTIPVNCDFVMLHSYGHGTSSSGQITLRLDLKEPAAGRHILVVEDILDTGHSLAWLLDHLAKKQPASIRTCVLLDKAARRQVPVRVDYVGFEIEDRFVAGYGIDYAERHRELPYVGYTQ